MLPDDALLTTDAGNFGGWIARGFRFGRRNGFLGPTSGAMGYGLPAAIAACLCQPGRTIVALCGDGGLAMTMNELETAVRERAKVVVVVFDNRRYGTIAMHQRNRGTAIVATELGAIDFAAVARACGAQGGRVTRDAEFEPALRDALAADRPAVIHLEMDPRWVGSGASRVSRSRSAPGQQPLHGKGAVSTAGLSIGAIVEDLEIDLVVEAARATRCWR